ncbi:MAG: type ISP restriction/modification enzyme [Patescibacteria group bacterium]
MHVISDQTYFFPLYIYNEQKENLIDENIPEKVPNFDMEIIGKIEEKLKMKLDEDFSPEDLFDYIYAVLHSKSYRETYKEFLKIDFPKVPFDVKKEEFFELVKL